MMSESPPPEAEVMADLAARFLQAIQDKDRGDLDRAEEQLRDILRVEPRLAEPHMELSRILLDTDRLPEAEPHAREALTQLERGGQWTEDVPESVLRGLAHALLAEILRRRADEDDVLFGDPEAFHALVREAQEHFQRAAALDPDDSYSSYHAFFLGDPQGAGKVLPATQPDD